MSGKWVGRAVMIAWTGLFAACSGSTTTTLNDGGADDSSGSSSSGGGSASGSGGGSGSGSSGSSGSGLGDASASSSSGSSGGAVCSASIVGSWTFIDTALDLAINLVFKDDGSYAENIVRVTTAQTWNDQEETGTYALSGCALTVTPKQSSCAGRDPVRTYAVANTNGDLVVSGSTGVIAFPPASPPAEGGAGVIITLGCFPGDGGGFMPSPLAPVQN